MTLDEIKTVTEAAADKTLDKFEEFLKAKMAHVPFALKMIDAVFAEAKSEEHRVIDAVVAELQANPPVPVV